ncbi:ABC transporter substrate-binding protein [Paenibacillus sp. S150]|uniref:ABC transporter substrate-binding protein n=1 Tax=Paenibacillus sp. S150 TaxID=2749826 RepID=UPI001C586891|nr:ABC transporter substrate-binding protein [Paenibacillus sp. S150]MBW4082555.1 ABC transporter substrate-binding protein [Paenibacillus sp. S150]
MRNQTKRISALWTALFLSVSLLSLAGCGNDKNTGGQAAAGSEADKTVAAASPPEAEPQATAAPEKKLAVLKVAASDWAYVADKKGWFKETFEALGTSVELVQGTLGNEAQLIARNDLHFANRMLYPLLQYKSQGADLTAVQVSVHPEPDIASIIVLADSPVKTFDDLKGKKIASWKAGCPYMVLYEKAETEGWTQGKDWTYVNIPSSENKTALLSKEVDAISTHLLGDVAALILNGSAREIANPDQESIYVQGGGATVTFTSTQFAKDYPNITKKYIELQDKTEAWMLANRDEAAEIVESVSRVPADISKFAWERMGSTWESAHDLTTIQAETAAMQNWLVEHGDIEADKKVDVTKLFDTQYFH